MREIDGKVAVVTGAASGIGRAIAARMAREGARVVLADIEQTALDTAVAELRDQNFDVMGVRTDVLRPESVQSLAQETLNRYGKIHLVFNHAGVEG